MSESAGHGAYGAAPQPPTFPVFGGISDGLHTDPRLHPTHLPAKPASAGVATGAAEYPTQPPGAPQTPAGFPMPPTAVRRVDPADLERELIAKQTTSTILGHIKREQARLSVNDSAAHSWKGDGGTERVTKLEFHTGQPGHLRAIVVLLLVSAFGMIPLMSAFALTVLLIGCISVYIADFLGYRRGTVVVMMVAAAAFGCAMFLSNIHAAMHSLGPLFMILDIIGILACAVGVAVMNFKWIQLTYPELILAIERVVHSVTPLLSLPSILATTTALIGSRNAPFVFSAIVCVIHWGLYGNTPSSFLWERRVIPCTAGGKPCAPLTSSKSRPPKPTRRVSEVETGLTKAMEEGPAQESSERSDAAGELDILVPTNITGVEEAVCFTLLLLLLPSAVYIAFQSNFFDKLQHNAMNLVGMVGIPTMYLFFSPGTSLWFLFSDEAENRDTAGEVRSPLTAELEGLCKILRNFIAKWRMVVLVGGHLLVLHWGVYRLLHSRYQHLFMGVPPPLNTIFLLATAYCMTFVVYHGKRLLDADARNEDLKPHLKMRLTIMLVSAAGAVCFAIVMGAPPPFYPLGAMSATTFNMFLIDRSNSGSLVLFTVFSSLLLMWWMYQTFSFILVDLRVLGESAVVPTPLVAVSVLWCYILGCMSFGMSFSENKLPFLAVLFTYSLKLAWVEHVLYSQKEEGAYPALLVFMTSGMGVWMASRLFNNGVLDITGAAVIAASFLSKIFTFFQEVTGSYYSREKLTNFAAEHEAVEIFVGWCACLVWAYVIAVIEIETRKQVERESVRRLMVLFTSSAAIMAICSVANIQRAVYEFMTQQYLSSRSHVHVAVGTCALSYSALTYFFLARHAAQYPFLLYGVRISKALAIIGVLVLITQPTQLFDRHDSQFDYEMLNVDTGRFFSIAGIGLLVLGRMLPISKVPQWLRVLLWFAAAVFLTMGLTVSLLPVTTVPLVMSIGCFVFLSLLTLDISHYRRLTSQEAWIVYGLSIVSAVFAFFALGRTDLRQYAGNNVMIMMEMHDTGRMHLLAVAMVVNLFIAIVLKFRLSGVPLLPYAIPMTDQIIEQVGLVGNYATFLAVSTMTALNLWANDNEPGIHIMTSLFLLLLVNDNALFFALDQKGFRYFPPLLFAVSMLWGSLILDAYRSHSTVLGGIVSVIKALWVAVPVLPSHVSLLTLLWLGKRSGGSRVPVVVGCVVLDLVCLVFSSRQVVQWMAIVGACGQIARLYEAQFWRKRAEVLL